MACDHTNVRVVKVKCPYLECWCLKQKACGLLKNSSVHIRNSRLHVGAVYSPAPRADRNNYWMFVHTKRVKTFPVRERMRQISNLF